MLPKGKLGSRGQTTPGAYPGHTHCTSTVFCTPFSVSWEHCTPLVEVTHTHARTLRLRRRVVGVVLCFQRARRKKAEKKIFIVRFCFDSPPVCLAQVLMLACFFCIDRRHFAVMTNMARRCRANHLPAPACKLRRVGRAQLAVIDFPPPRTKSKPVDPLTCKPYHRISISSTISQYHESRRHPVFSDACAL